jgi:hypothetical protein
MSETRKLAAIFVADIVRYSKLEGAEEDGILARLRTLRSDLIDPTISVHHGRVLKRTRDGAIIEFRSVADSVRCAFEVQNELAASCPARTGLGWHAQGGSAGGMNENRKLAAIPAAHIDFHSGTAGLDISL